MRFPVGDIVDTVVSDAGGVALNRALCTLADDLNSSLLYYEVTLEHFDGENFLRFEERTAEEIEAIEDYEEATEAMRAAA